MIDRQFWGDAKKAWIVKAPPKIKDIKTGSGGSIDPSLLKDPWDIEVISFDEVDLDEDAQAENPNIIKLEEQPQLDPDKFESLIEKQTIHDYVEACKLLRECELPEEMDDLYASLIERMPVLQDVIVKFEGVYQADIIQFYEYYIPEALQLTATYLEYLNLGIDEQIILETRKEVMDAVNKLLIAVNDKIDEIYKFASLEIKAKAKALESLMSQDGYVDSNFKIN